ncbi:M14 family metallopeptidase [Flavobacterium rhizosphaerae]|uniref:M14 family metallopeptidase n=1 Tax=Flavobacterium rhizosphaerae TaxID=3163298 RepID=A0ABW8YZN8_9FLAO
MKHYLSALLLFTVCFLHAQLKSPADFLPDYGNQVTYYHQFESYFAHLVQNSDYIQHQPYGITNEGRGLNAYYISTPENLKNLTAIQQNHLYAIGMADKKAADTADKVIVWLSFNVHGNEPAAAESAMNVAYELVNPDNKETKDWLKDVIVILDPCLNPDGYARYGNWLHTVTGKSLHTGSTDREHMEPWPGGRQNHYGYDLNRDWAWQVQAETQQRMALYNQWMPMVHVDVHEMGYNEPYFFPPPAEPMHDYITRAQKDFHTAIGEMTAKKFDANGWSYYTREVFDLFYPSYGDTYPTFNGAVGMTYEQGGIGAGRAITLNNGTVLTLKDRIDHHTAALLTAVETSAWQKDKLIKNFSAYFAESRQNPKGAYRSYIVKYNGETAQLAKLLERNKIQFAYADETRKLTGFDYQAGAEKDFIIEPNDMVISVNQPKAVLTQVLFEPVQHLSDSLSYDITAWALPLAYSTKSYALKKDMAIKTKNATVQKGKMEYERVYAYYIPWNGRSAAKVLAQLFKNDIKVRSANKASHYRGININPGDLVVLKSDNAKVSAFEETMTVLLDGKNDFEVIESGYSVKGGDLGGESFTLLTAPKVLLLSGRGVDVTDFGQVWFYMDEIIDYPVSIVDLTEFSRIDLHEFNTLVLANGWYDFSDTEKITIDGFISRGGKVIAIDGALNIFEDREGYSLTKFSSAGGKEAESKIDLSAHLQPLTGNYESIMRNELQNSVSGAIVQNVADSTHPLGYGLGGSYYSLKTNNSHYQLLEGAQNVIYVPKNYNSYGFIGNLLKKKLPGTVTFAVAQKGRGQIIYMVDNPLFRGFWENGNLLFSNALFLVN